MVLCCAQVHNQAKRSRGLRAAHSGQHSQDLKAKLVQLARMELTLGADLVTLVLGGQVPACLQAAQ